MLKWLYLLVGAALLGAAFVPVAVTWIERRQARPAQPSALTVTSARVYAGAWSR